MKHIFRLFNGWNDREKRLIFEAETPKLPETKNEKEGAPEAPQPKTPEEIQKNGVNGAEETKEEVNKDAEQKEGARGKFENNPNTEQLRQEIQDILKDASPEAARFAEALLQRVEEMKDTLSAGDFKNGLQTMIDLGPQFALNYMAIPPEERDAPELQEDKATFETAYNALDANGKIAFQEVAQLLVAQGANENNNNPGKNGKELSPEAQKKLKESAEKALPKPEEAKKLSQGDLDRRIGSVMMNFGVSVTVNAETKEMTVVPPTSGWDKFFNTIIGAGMYLLSYYSDAKQKFGGLFNKQAAAPSTTPSATPDANDPAKPGENPSDSMSEIPGELAKEVKEKGLKAMRTEATEKKDEAGKKLTVARAESSAEETKLIQLKADFDKAKTDFGNKPEDKDAVEKLEDAMKQAEAKVKEQEAIVEAKKKAVTDAEKEMNDASTKLNGIESAEKSSEQNVKKMNEDLGNLVKILENPPLSTNERAMKLSSLIDGEEVSVDDNLLYEMSLWDEEANELTNIGIGMGIPRETFKFNGTAADVSKTIDAIKTIVKSFEEKVQMNDKTIAALKEKGLENDDAVLVANLNSSYEIGLDYGDKKFSFKAGNEKMAVKAFANENLSKQMNADVVDQINAALKNMSRETAMDTLQPLLNLGFMLNDNDLRNFFVELEAINANPVFQIDPLDKAKVVVTSTTAKADDMQKAIDKSAASVKALFKVVTPQK